LPFKNLLGAGGGLTFFGKTKTPGGVLVWGALLGKHPGSLLWGKKRIYKKNPPPIILKKIPLGGFFLWLLMGVGGGLLILKKF